MGEKERLFDLLIHDLTSPLSIVSTSVNNLLHKTDRYGPITDQQRRILERILRNSRKAQSLLQEMVEVLRSKEGLFQKELFPVEEILRESILDVLEMTTSDEVEKPCHTESEEEFQKFLESRGIFVEVTGKYCHHPFCHDQKKVKQILRNLMSNAMRYRQKRIDLSISGERDLMIFVKDDGRGIPQKDQEIIFQRFIRLNDKKNAESPGLGLGLSGVKTLVEAMGGEITVESREGFGTQFMVRFPPLDLKSYPNKGGGIMTESVLNGKKILAVDDEPDVLKILEEEIMGACPNCQFQKATTYESAAEMLKSQPYDVVILDIMGVRGFDLLDLAVSRNFRVAMLTAHALSPEALKRSFELKARAYLPKEKLGEVLPFLEDVLKYEYLPGWRRLFEKLKGFFDQKFESDWEKKTGLQWQEWHK